ncbi:hypothetical protein CHH83_00700 [Bacillus sp. 7586-K]|nr:hypothetical protein CHH83_00700 [Bacillus sp. 7586-K]
MKQRKSPLLLIGIAVIGLIVLSICFSALWHFLTQTIFYYHMDSQLGHGRDGFQPRGAGFIGHDFGFSFSFLSLLVNIGIITLGWWILKKANGETVKKWVGIILLLGGLWAILPKIIAIPLVLIALYITFRGCKSKETIFEEQVNATYPIYNTASHNILDEWERKNN